MFYDLEDDRKFHTSKTTRILTVYWTGLTDVHIHAYLHQYNVHLSVDVHAHRLIQKDVQGIVEFDTEICTLYHSIQTDVQCIAWLDAERCTMYA